MKVDLDQLSAMMQKNLHRVVQILFEEFADAHGKPTGDRKLGRMVKIILHGNGTCADGFEDKEVQEGARQAIDILIIVNIKAVADRKDYWSKAEERFRIEFLFTRNIQFPVNFIVHTLQEVNDGLAHGREFFMNIARNGIVLYQSDDTALLSPRPKKPEESLARAKDYYGHWFPRAADFFESAKHALGRGKFNHTAYLLHEAAERLYYCVLLVGNSYTPFVRSLLILRREAEKLDFRLCDIWPRNRSRDKLFVKLNDVSLLARTVRDFHINADQIAWLVERVEVLGQVVQTVCADRISALEAAVVEKGDSIHCESLVTLQSKSGSDRHA